CLSILRSPPCNGERKSTRQGDCTVFLHKITSLSRLHTDASLPIAIHVFWYEHVSWHEKRSALKKKSELQQRHPNKRHPNKRIRSKQGTFLMSTYTALGPAISPESRTLLDQYGCGPFRFAGTENALYERHLLFDNVTDLAEVAPRDRFEAAARSVRDILSQ